MYIFRRRHGAASSPESDPGLACSSADYEMSSQPAHTEINQRPETSIDISRGELIKSLAALNLTNPSLGQLAEIVALRCQYYDSYMDEVWRISGKAGIDEVIDFSLAELQLRAKGINQVIDLQSQLRPRYNPDPGYFTQHLFLRTEELGQLSDQSPFNQDIVCQAAFNLLEEASGTEFSVLIAPSASSR